jgi:predicted PurR-regulated permease PerM
MDAKELNKLEQRVNELEMQLDFNAKTVAKQMSNLVDANEEMKRYVKEMLNEYQSKTWNLVDRLIKFIFILVGIIALFAGIKLTGIMDLLKLF